MTVNAKTLADGTARTPYPSWVREVTTDVRSGLNVAAVRARSAGCAALAPFDVVLERDDGSRVWLPLAGVEVTPTRMVLVVRLPRVAG